jgi:hypothetical protein
MNFAPLLLITLRATACSHFQNANYYSQSYFYRSNLFQQHGWIIAGDFDYTYSGNHADGYNTSVPLFNTIHRQTIFEKQCR